MAGRQVLFPEHFYTDISERRRVVGGIVTRNFLVADHGRLIVKGFSHFPIDMAGAESVYPEINGEWGKLRPVDKGAVICGGPHGADSYWHWMLDYFPRLALVEDEWPIIVNSDLTPVQIEMLGLAGRSNWILKEPDEALYVADLLAPSFLSRTGCIYPKAVEFVRQFRIESGPEKIYVSRRGVPARALSNEDEIEQAMAALGFEIVVPHELTFDEQRRTFGNARVICGPHGGGLANAIFAPEGCRIVEIFTKAHTAHAFLAAACNHFHRHVVCGIEDNRLFAPVGDVVRACTL